MITKLRTISSRFLSASSPRQTLRTPRFIPLTPSLSLLRPIRPFTTTLPAFQTPPSESAIPIKQMSASEYDRVADEDMDSLHDNLEILCEDYMTGAEVEYSSGVMTLITPRGTYVINKQPPNQQIWISSPLSGPARFGYSPDGTWVHHRRKDVTLGGVLDKELKELAGETDWEGTGLR